MSAQASRQSPRIFVALSFCMALQMTGFIMIQPLFARRLESFGAGIDDAGVSREKQIAGDGCAKLFDHLEAMDIDYFAEFFAFFGVSGKFASVFGPLIYGILVAITGSVRSGILSVLVFFLFSTAALWVFGAAWSLRSSD